MVLVFPGGEIQGAGLRIGTVGERETPRGALAATLEAIATTRGAVYVAEQIHDADGGHEPVRYVVDFRTDFPGVVPGSGLIMTPPGIARPSYYMTYPAEAGREGVLCKIWKDNPTRLYRVQVFHGGEHLRELIITHDAVTRHRIGIVGGLLTYGYRFARECTE